MNDHSHSKPKNNKKCCDDSRQEDHLPLCIIDYNDVNSPFYECRKAISELDDILDKFKAAIDMMTTPCTDTNVPASYSSDSCMMPCPSQACPEEIVLDRLHNILTSCLQHNSSCEKPYCQLDAKEIIQICLVNLTCSNTPPPTCITAIEDNRNRSVNACSNPQCSFFKPKQSDDIHRKPVEPEHIKKYKPRFIEPKVMEIPEFSESEYQSETKTDIDFKQNQSDVERKVMEIPEFSESEYQSETKTDIDFKQNQSDDIHRKLVAEPEHIKKDKPRFIEPKVMEIPEFSESEYRSETKTDIDNAGYDPETSKTIAEDADQEAGKDDSSQKPREVKTVLVLYVGGTIGMEKNKDGVYTPSPKKMHRIIKGNSELYVNMMTEKYVNNKDIQEKRLMLPLSGNGVVLYHIKEYETLLDSSNMSSKDWIKISKDIEASYEEFDGFVILHGTDTLAYTASALSFMLEGLQKPVILTGSQIPIFESRSDAKSNIFSSIILAASCNVPEVCIFFANQLLRGNRTEKLSSTHISAFHSPNYPILAEVGVEITLNKFYIRKPELGPFKVYADLNPNVAMLTFFPTITCALLQSFLQEPLEGLVLQTYGAGNIPAQRLELMQIFKNAISRGLLIVNITQCSQGSLVASYETGKALEDLGIISGFDMTPEAALTKLCHVLGLPGLNFNERARLITIDIRGELTNNTNTN